MNTSPSRVGRPRRSSRETIEDAAVELFLEQGYPGTSVDQIAQRAGVSRASFFNYFASKSDVLWVAFDESSGRLADALADPATGSDGLDRVISALVAVAADFGPERAPWAVTEAEAMRIGTELGESALPRFAELAATVARHLHRAGYEPTRARALSAALLAASASVAVDWARAGSRRGSLSPRVEHTLRSLARGWSADG